VQHAGWLSGKQSERITTYSNKKPPCLESQVMAGLSVIPGDRIGAEVALAIVSRNGLAKDGEPGKRSGAQPSRRFLRS